NSTLSLLSLAVPGFLVAEKEGFEPSRPFRGLHDFQSCALDQLGDFSMADPVSHRLPLYTAKIDSVIIIPELFEKSTPQKRKKRILKKRGGPQPSSPRLSAFRKRCCPRHGPRRHPACGYFSPPVFSWGPC